MKAVFSTIVIVYELRLKETTSFMSKILGIDSGTGFSAMSIMEGGNAEIITNKEGARTTPSIIAWTKTGERLIGQAAKRQAVTNAKNTVYEFKRLMGKKYSEIKDELKQFSYEIVPNEKDECRVKINDKLYSPEELTAMVLRKLKEDAEAYLGEKITQAVITCPAYWNSDQRQAVKNAGAIAGLEVLRVINEPTAASISYGLDKSGTKTKTIAVADAGAGTLDFTILEMCDGVFEVKATSGDPKLGGKDYDAKIVDWLISEFKADTGIDLGNDGMAKQRLKDEAEKAKIALSTASTIEINLPFISADATGPKHLVRELSRSKFESLVADLNDRYVAPAKQCISDAGVDKIDEVILVGGTTRIPSVQAKIKEIFGIEPSKTVNPDECVAQGAAIQGGVLKGEVKDVLLLDVIPLTLSICTGGQLATPMIERNTTIPTKKTQTFSNAAPMQSIASVQICQGERKMFADNKHLGQFNVEITPCPNVGQSQIEVTYDVDANGILTVTAKDLALNKVADITITNSSGLSKEEIEKAKADAEAHKAEDDMRVELVNTKITTESYCAAIEKTFENAKDGELTEDDKKPVLDQIAKVREALKTDDLSAIKKEHEELAKLFVIASEKLTPQNSGTPNFSQEDYEKMKNDPRFAGMFGADSPFNGNAAANQTSSAAASPDEPVDAEFTESK